MDILPRLPISRSLTVLVGASLSLLAFGATIARAETPKLTVVGLKTATVVGGTFPITEVGDSAALDVAYHAQLPAGARLRLFVKKYSTAPYRASSTPVNLRGGHASVKVTEPGIGGPITYEVAVVRGASREAASRPVVIVWASEPGGVFVFGPTDNEHEFTSARVASESCAAGCSSTGVAGLGGEPEVKSATGPVAPGWKVRLLYNGGVLCEAETTEDECKAPFTYPMSESTFVGSFTGEMIGPRGRRIVAVMNVTVYPN